MNYFYALILGILSILGPCTFIMIPTIVHRSKNSYFQVIYFFTGIIFVFILIGSIASVTGIVFTNNINRYLYLIAGLITVISGLKILGAVKIEYPHLKEPDKTSHSFLDGILHGGVMLGCIGPQLAAILSFIIAQRNIINGIFMTFFFSLGFILPFIIFGTMIKDESIQVKILAHINIIQKIGGIFMLGAATYLLYFSFQGII